MNVEALLSSKLLHLPLNIKLSKAGGSSRGQCRAYLLNKRQVINENSVISSNDSVSYHLDLCFCFFNFWVVLM